MAQPELDQLRSIVQDSLGKHMYDNAIFFADKLVTMSDGAADDVFLLCQAYVFTKQNRRALHVLRKTGLAGSSARFCYLTAKCLAECQEWDDALDCLDQRALDLAAEGFDATAHRGLGLERLDGGIYPFTDRLEIHFIEENAARWSAFSSGEVDNVMVPNEQVESVLSSSDPIEFQPGISERYHGHAGIEAGFVYAGFNMADERYGHHPDPQRDAANRALRCAIRDAFDWQARNDTFYYGIGEIFPGVIPPVVPEFDPDRSRESVQHDVEKGRALLADHGWTTDRLPELTYGLISSVQQRQMYAQLRAQMVELGFPMNKIAADTFASFGDFSRAMKNRRLDLFFLGWTLDYPDAQNTLQLFYGPYETPGSNNFNYRNPEFDALYEQAATMQPGPERTAIYRRMNGMIIDDCVAISGLSRTRIHLWNKDVAMLPDREILGGFFMRFVDVARPDGE
jgi:ABC-type oligopeptide transport system substrate-binding subunit